MRRISMNKRNKFLLYGALLLVGLTAFILEVFVFQKPDGILGFLICLVSILLTFGSIVKLCRLSPKFEDGFLKTLDILFWLP